MIGDLFRGEQQLVPAALRGYRCWDGLTSDGRLNSTGQTVNPLRHEAPYAACGCGLYGWYRPEDHRIVNRGIFGAVAATGRAVLGTHGFRAQRATVIGDAAHALAKAQATLAAVGSSAADVIAVLAAFADEAEPDPEEPLSPQERALRARRTRHTGPPRLPFQKRGRA